MNSYQTNTRDSLEVTIVPGLFTSLHAVNTFKPENLNTVMIFNF